MRVLFALVALVALVSQAAAICATTASSYNYANQGKDWEGTCACGSQQSPINIDTDYVVRSVVDDIACPAAEGRTFEATIEYGLNYGSLKTTPLTDSLMTSGGQMLVEKHKMIQNHMHAPSEHTINGVQYPLEIHYVHASGYGMYSVVGYMFQVSDSSADFIGDLAAWLRNNGDVPADEKTTRTYTANMELPNQGEFYHYMGSFTTPPCTERVNFHVYANPLPITSRDLETITNYLTPNNYRVTMPLNGRVVGLGGWSDPLNDDSDDSSASRMSVALGAAGAAVANTARKMF